jgi:hypothetical protein
MTLVADALTLLEQEARALLTRLARVTPFALNMPTVPSAAISPLALKAIDLSLISGRRELRKQVLRYIEWLNSVGRRRASPVEAHRRYRLLRLRFNAVLSQLDIFADVLTQRSEHETGVWIAGLDVLATDALRLPGNFYKLPPVICYLDRGAGAAIRRARTRLPGGGPNPVAIVRVPRERMIGSGIASSLVHEVGHQGSALLDLVNSMRPVLQEQQMQAGEQQLVWRLFERWISELLADFWSVAKIGISSTLGLMGVVSLPRAFVFRMGMDDPHPFPWIRVKLSCAIGRTLYPHPQWDELERTWESYYPTNDINEEKREMLGILQDNIPRLIHLLIHHCPKSLRGQSLIEVMPIEERQPKRLRNYYRSWRYSQSGMLTAPPSLVFAVIGQAKADGKISPQKESDLLEVLLRHWALRTALQTSARHLLPTVNRLPRKTETFSARQFN